MKVHVEKTHLHIIMFMSEIAATLETKLFTDINSIQREKTRLASNKAALVTGLKGFCVNVSA